ncbi:MAG: Uncharacterized protein XD63_1451 [Thermoanaerobacterales bacterium 50_218]|nr:MAG: Uncharacterized protein XD63_1451 [Thermoanaerobacterales bacterium 50_218]HAA89913.1 DUF503 domain-containing protein [Peptococcaceae bacterium]
MVVGLCTVELYLAEAYSLKEKRRILKSVLDKVRARYNVSIAEVDHQELWQRATLAFACVSNDQGHLHKVLDAVIRFIENQNGAEIIDFQTEIL